MEFRMLRYLVEIANTGTITAAAKNLNLTQPALSRQIQVLEQELGVELLDRSKKPIQLTGQGIYLVKQSEKILNLTDKTIVNLQSNNNVAGEITIGAAETPLFAKVINAISKLQNAFPNVIINLVSGSLNDLLDRLNSGEIDFLFALDFYSKGQYDYIDFKDGNLRGVYLNNNHELANQNNIYKEQLAEFPLIVSRNPTWKEFISSFTGHPINELNVKMTFNLFGNAVLYPKTNEKILLLGIEGLNDDNQIKFIPFSPSKTSFATLVWKHTQFMSSLHEEFIYYLNSELANKG